MIESAIYGLSMINSQYNKATYISQSTQISNQGREEDPPTKVDPQSTSIVSGSDRSSGGIVEEGEMCGTDFTSEKGAGKRESTREKQGCRSLRDWNTGKKQVTTE